MLGTGGNGGSNYGAGGGGGYYGGGGGDGCAGGGGGSSFAVLTATGVKMMQGVQTGNGQVVVTW
jgi:hypothetical protein